MPQIPARKFAVLMELNQPTTFSLVNSHLFVHFTNDTVHSIHYT